ncbi:helix-turn-helix domain-containing protein [Plantactinospora sp. WMMB334]|uniref:helix-turn-helix domain-containing protein n=1 Tax=Plantactinospora sp. WMMB334 TaxID=3404119 RepID=UPI003B95D75E
MRTLTQIHSIPVRPQPLPCETVARLPDVRLRRHVLGYAGFRAGARSALPHRILPLNLATLVIDFAAPYALVTGARSTPTVAGPSTWAYGVSVGLTPEGVAALLGVPMPELAGTAVPLPDLLGRRATALAERLVAAPDWAARFALLDRILTAEILGGATAGAAPQPDGTVSSAWWQLQRAPAGLRIGALADRVGVSRRCLELRFRRQIGLTPGTVARIARFQRAVGLLAGGGALAGTATDTGYADQPHFTREVRALSGLTPTELCAFLQDLVPARG